MQPILFSLQGQPAGLQNNGIPALLLGRLPAPAGRSAIAGVSRDSTGVALAGCTVTLFRVVTGSDGNPSYTQVDTMVSDAGGNYSFNVASDSVYRVTWDLAGAPIRAGVSLNTLVGV